MALRGPDVTASGPSLWKLLQSHPSRCIISIMTGRFWQDSIKVTEVQASCARQCFESLALDFRILPNQERQLSTAQLSEMGIVIDPTTLPLLVWLSGKMSRLELNGFAAFLQESLTDKQLGIFFTLMAEEERRASRERGR